MVNASPEALRIITPTMFSLNKIYVNIYVADYRGHPLHLQYNASASTSCNDTVFYIGSNVLLSFTEPKVTRVTVVSTTTNKKPSKNATLRQIIIDSSYLLFIIFLSSGDAFHTNVLLCFVLKPVPIEL